MHDVTPATVPAPVEASELIRVNGRVVAATVATVLALGGGTYGGIWGGGRVEVKPKGKPTVSALAPVPGGGLIGLW